MSTTLSKPFTACIFDMDGVLLDSEPFWRQAEREIFASVGLNLSEEDCMETMGVRIDELVRYRHHQHPWSHPSCTDIAAQIQYRVAELVQEKGTKLPGVMEAISFLQDRKLRLALASSSSYMLINAVLEALSLRNIFSVICSAEKETYGKPHPAVYIHTAQALGIDPVDCLAIEDSINGVFAAKAAKMTCVAIPEPAMRHNKKFAAADLKLNSLLELPHRYNELLEERE
ncbi:MAG: hexitol phosphatase HxpB [Candidatus Bruticola sp.]